MREKIQCVIIELSDGTKVKFYGRAVIESGDTRTIKGIRFTESFCLPEGYEFEELRKGENHEII